MMTPSSIVIALDGVDITNSVVFAQTHFQSQANPMQGTFKVTVRDPDRTFSASAGQKLALFIDGVPLTGGYVMRLSQGNFLPADDTSVPVRTRRWVLEGPDFNSIFAKRVIYDPSNPTVSPEVPSGKRTITKAFRHFMNNYIDVPAGLDYSTYVDVIRDDDGGLTEYGDEEKGSMYVGASKTWREQMEDFAEHSGVIYYIDADFRLHMHAYESMRSPWTITDKALPGLVNFREGEYSKDFTRIITEAHIWGGSSTKVADGGTGGKVVYTKYPDPPANNAREQDAIDRLNAYGKWQVGEEHVGQNNYLTQKSINVRSRVIISGPTGSVPTYGLEGGYSRPLERFTCTWFAHDVPGLQHIRPGTLQDIILYSQGVTTRLPLRSMDISFPTIPTDNAGKQTYVEFRGEFGVTYSDSRYLWEFLQKTRYRRQGLVTSVVGNDTTTVENGSLATVYPLEKANGTRKSFTFPFTFYLGRFDLFLNGLYQRPSIDYRYSGDTKQVTLTSAPGIGDQMYAVGYVSQ